MTLMEILESLDGAGLVIEDEEQVEHWLLNVLNIDPHTEVDSI